MNKKFKFLTVLLALVMTLSAFAPFSARAEEVKETKTVTLHKILMTKSNLNSENARRVTVVYTNKNGKTESKELVIIKKDENNYELAAQSKDDIAKIGASINDKLNTTEKLKALYNDKDAKAVFKGTIGLDGTSYNGNVIDKITQYFGDGAKDIGRVYFAWAKKDTDGKYYWIKPDGNFTETKTEVNEKELDKLPADTFGGETVKDKGIEFATNTFKGEYKIYEIHAKSSYKGDNGEALTDMKAVPVEITLPLVNETGVVVNAHVYPKNIEDKPKIDKNFSVEEAKNHISADEAKNLDAAIQHKIAFDNAKKTYAENEQQYIDAKNAYTNDDKALIAKWGIDFDDNQREKQEVYKKIGDDVKYVVETEIPKDAKYKKLVWTDQMTKGLTYNKDLEVKLGTTTLAENTDYKVINTDRGFTLKFTADGIKKVEEAAKTAAQTITLKYSAKVNEKSIVDKPDANDVAFDYSNKPGKDSEPKEGQPKDQKIKVVKDWAVDGQNTITEADKNVKALFTLQEKQTDGTWKDVATHEVTAANHFEYEFTGLDDTKTYRVIEQVSGYEPEYISMVNGVATIKNEKDSTNPKPLNPSEPKVVTGGKRFVKTNQDGTERLAGAEFYVKNSEGKYLVADQKDATKVTTARDLYINLIAAYNDAIKKATGATVEEKEKSVTVKNPLFKNATETPNEKENLVGKTEISQKINDLRLAYEKAFKENAIAYKWGEKTDANVVILTSDGQGRFEITGLAYGTYYLEEKEAPADYAKLNQEVEFVVKKGSYNGQPEGVNHKHIGYDSDTDTIKGQQIENKKVSIPQTGGIGTVIFTVVGVMLMVGAAFALKRRKEDELEGLA